MLSDCLHVDRRGQRRFDLFVCYLCYQIVCMLTEKNREDFTCLLPVLSDCLHVDRKGQRRFYLFVCYLCSQIVCMLIEEDRKGFTCLLPVWSGRTRQLFSSH